MGLTLDIQVDGRPAPHLTARWQRLEVRHRLGDAYDAATLIFPVADAVRDYVTAWPSGPTAIRRVVSNHGGFVLAGVAAFSPQMWFWNRVRGHWLNAPVTEHGVSWLQTEVGAGVVIAPSRALLDQPDHVCRSLGRRAVHVFWPGQAFRLALAPDLPGTALCQQYSRELVGRRQGSGRDDSPTVRCSSRSDWRHR